MVDYKCVCQKQKEVLYAKQTLGGSSRGHTPCKGRMVTHQVIDVSMKLLFARSLGLCYSSGV